MEQNYKSNSHRSKTEKKSTEEKPEVKKVISGNARVKKKNGLGILAENFIQEDVKNIKSYVIMDVIIPTVKNAIVDIVENGINMLIFGETRGRKKSSGNRVSYRDYYEKSNNRRESNRVTSGYTYNDVIVDTRGEAEDVLDSMQDIIDEYGEVTVASLFDLVGISAQYTDQKYGWTTLAEAKPVRARDGGYLIDLPRPRALK